LKSQSMPLIFQAHTHTHTHKQVLVHSHHASPLVPPAWRSAPRRAQYESALIGRCRRLRRCGRRRPPGTVHCVAVIDAEISSIDPC
jgi:hypothetical protein